MANLHQILLTVLILQIHANAAPSEIPHKNIEPEPNVAKVNDSSTAEKDAITEQGQRQKRQYFNGFDSGISSFNPFYQGQSLDQSAQAGGYGFENPYAFIHRRLQDILEGFRRPAYNVPPPVSFPPRGLFQFLVPVIYIPQTDCSCFPEQIPPNNQIPDFNFDFPSNNQNPEYETPIDNQTPRVDEMPTNSPIPDNQNSTSNQMHNETPNNNQLDDRTPVEASTENQPSPPNPEQPDTGDDDEFTRPISFDPIPPPIRTTSRPPPSVNHGSMQAGLPDSTTAAPNVTDSEEDFTRPISFDPIPPSRNVNRPQPAVDHGIMQAGSAPSAVTTVAPVLEAANPLSASAAIENRFGSPDLSASATEKTLTACDMAILNCCHQPEVKLSCFALENCPQLITNNPCSANVVLSAIDRYQHFYGEKSW